MTDEFDPLRPEVREAVQELDGKAYPGSRTHERWQIIHAELLRLADENKRMRGIIETLDIEGHRRAEKVEAELAALKARAQWQPIETAPKDGTIVLVTAAGEWSGLNGKTAIVIESAYWHDGAWNGNQDNRSILEQDWPTHWMPLPEPPAERGEG